MLPSMNHSLKLPPPLLLPSFQPGVAYPVTQITAIACPSRMLWLSTTQLQRLLPSTLAPALHPLAFAGFQLWARQNQDVSVLVNVLTGTYIGVGGTTQLRKATRYCTSNLLLHLTLAMSVSSHFWPFAANLVHFVNFVVSSPPFCSVLCCLAYYSTPPSL